MMPLMFFGFFILIQIISLICFIIVLINLFKEEGALKGIFGFFCGIYTFVWGWIKHRELRLTKVMGFWTLVTVISFVAPFVLAVTAPFMMQDMPFLDKELKARFKNMQKPGKALTTRPPVKRRKPVVPATAKTSTDPVQNAIALWQGGKYTDPNKAIQYLNAAIAADPNSAVNFNSRGLAFKDLGQYQKAIADYNQAIKLDPNYVQAYNNRGIAHYDTKNFPLAINDYSKSIQLKPDYSNAYLNRGIAYYQLSDITTACKDFHKACELKDCDGIEWALKKNLCR